MGKATANESTSFDQFIAKHLPNLRRYIEKRMGNALRRKESPSDLLQTSLREVLSKPNRANKQSKSNFLRWLYKTASRKIIDRARFWQLAKRNLQRETSFKEFSQHQSPSHLLSMQEELGKLQQAFAQLPKDYQEVIYLIRIQNYSFGQAAKHMQRSEKAVSNLLYRALAKLSSVMVQNEDE